VSLDGGHDWLTVIGIVQNAKNNGLAVPASPEYYRTLAGTGTRLELSSVILIRSGLSFATLSRLISRQISALDPTLSPVIEPMSERLRRLNDRPRFLTVVLFVFAFVSVLLSAGGLYGVITFLVNGRTREFGIRTALGATRLDIIVLVQRQMLWFGLVGLAMGLAGSLSLGRLVRGLLFQVSPHDPLVLSAAAALLFAISMLAVLKPAWEAAHTDPAQALRVE
jgi:putative ABC transport system permease protein